MKLRRTLRRSRALHFLALGGLIFLLARRGEEPRRVSISRASLEALQAAEAQHAGTDRLSAEAACEVEARAVEDEVLYREALRLGLDQGDPIVRQRLVQKLLLLVEDLGGASRAPTEGELRAYWEETRARRRAPAAYRIVHVFSRTRGGVPPARVLEGATEAPGAGDPFPEPRAVTRTKRELAAAHGDAFAEAVAALAPGSVSEPVPSRLGWHRVRLVERTEGGPASFEQARADLELEYALVRRERIVGAWLAKTVGAYVISIDGKPLAGFVPTRRVAARPDWSAED